MISPAFSTTTRSPIFRSSRATSSQLNSEARLTVVPDRMTGSRMATGVTAPVRPTFTSMSRTTVSDRSAGNL